MNNYTVFTDCGSWTIQADDIVDAMRKALWYSWRDNENFIKLVDEKHPRYEYRIAQIHS